MTFRSDIDPAGSRPAGDAAHILALQTEAADMRDRWMRAEAEMANVRTRARRDVEDAKLYAVQKFATDVVEGVENLRRGLDSLSTDPQAGGAIAKVRQGFEEVERNFLMLLSRNGVVRDEAVGARFDPAHHQAVSTRASKDVEPGFIIQTLSAGWSLGRRLLRPAKVVVAKAPEAEHAANGPVEASS